MAVHQLNLPVAEEVVKKAKTKSVESTKTQQSKFDQSLETTKTQPSQNAQPAQATTKAQKANKPWAANATNATHATLQTAHSAPTSRIQRASFNRVNSSTKVETSFANTFREIEHGQGQMEKILKEAMSGRKFDQQELLVLQAGVMRYAQELELASKVVEKATNGVKDTLKTQV